MNLRSPPRTGDECRVRQPGPRPTGLVVALVDDNSADNLYHRLALEEVVEDVEVVELTGGPAAIDYLLRSAGAGSPPDLLLLDLNMPGMSGWEFLDFCRKNVLDRCPDLTVIVLSTSENPDDSDRADADELVDAFVRKPLDARRVAWLVSKFRPAA